MVLRTELCIVKSVSGLPSKSTTCCNTHPHSPCQDKVPNSLPCTAVQMPTSASSAPVLGATRMLPLIPQSSELLLLSNLPSIPIHSVPNQEGMTVQKYRCAALSRRCCIAGHLVVGAAQQADFQSGVLAGRRQGVPGV